MLLHMIIGLSFAWVAILLSGWLGWQLLRQNGRVLLRLEELEKRLDAIEFGEQNEHSENGGAREDRFGNRSLARSKIKRDGLKAGTIAPEFRLPRLDGKGDLGLEELRGRRVLLVFSSPECGPCAALAPQLEQLHRAHPQIEIVLISRGEPKENRQKVKEHGLTFTVVLQQQWEISRRYAMFATPIGYLIDEAGLIARDVAIGAEAILGLLTTQNGDNEPISLAEAAPQKEWEPQPELSN